MSSPDYKAQFPVFKNHPTLVYLDSAATGLKPESVIAAERDYE
jgi:cysteine desulfurase/selenocysteine lyase